MLCREEAEGATGGRNRKDRKNAGNNIGAHHQGSELNESFSMLPLHPHPLRLRVAFFRGTSLYQEICS